MRKSLTLVALLAASSPTSAQLVVAADTSDGAYHIDVQSGKATPLWSNITQINGLAVDEAMRKIWLTSFFVLRDWEYYEKNQGLVGQLVLMPGLAIGDGVLYGVTEFPPRIVGVDPAALTMTDVTALSGSWGVDDLAWDSQSRRLFFPLVASNNAALGIYSVDPVGGGSPAFVTSFPAGYDQVTGLAVGSGKIWIMQPGLPIRAFDSISAQWTPISLPNPLSTSADGAMDWSGRLPLRFTYCTARTSASGCTPTIGVAEGYASAGGSSAFTVEARGAVNQSTGLLVYALSGAANLPFFGGTLCVAAPAFRTPLVPSGGSAASVVDCTGLWRIDLNQFAAGQGGGAPRPELSRFGTTVHCQWLGRDRTDPSRMQLSDALRYDVEP